MSLGEEGVRTAAPHGAGLSWRLLLLVFGAAALLYMAVWRLSARLSGRAEGGVLSLSRQEGGEWVALKEGVGVPSRTRVRFSLRLSRAASVVLIGLNAEGRATLYAPTSGSPRRLQEGTSTVAEQALDGVLGPELFLAVLCNTPLAPAVILKAGERAAAAAVEPSDVQTLDLGCPEARFRLLKQAPP